MYKIALVALLSLPLFAGFFPQTVHTSIGAIQGQSITLKNAFPAVGMSGVVVHSYGKDLNAITTRIVQTSAQGSATLLGVDVLEHDALPTIKTTMVVGDKVIGGYLYDNILLLAPDADTYARIVATDAKKWIHPDLYAVYLASEDEAQPTKENLANFAKKYQVGLVYIIRKNSAVLLDPISGKIVSQKSVSGLPKEGKFPFFNRLDPIESGWFGGDAKTGNYYNIMESL